MAALRGDKRRIALAVPVIAGLLLAGCFDAFTAHDAWTMHDVALGPGDRLTLVGSPHGPARVWDVDPWTGIMFEIAVDVPGDIKRVQWGTGGELYVGSRTTDGESIWQVTGNESLRLTPVLNRIGPFAARNGEVFALVGTGESIRLPGEVNHVPLFDLFRLTPSATVRLTNESWTHAQGLAMVANGTLFIDAGVGSGDYDDPPISQRFFRWTVDGGLEQGLLPSHADVLARRVVQWACQDPLDPDLVQLRALPGTRSGDVREIMLVRAASGTIESRIAIPENGCLMGSRDQLIVYENYCGQFSCQDNLRRVDLETGTAMELVT